MRRLKPASGLSKPAQKKKKKKKKKKKITVGTVNMTRAGRQRNSGSIPGKGKAFSSLQSVQATGYGFPPTPLSSTYR